MRLKAALKEMRLMSYKSALLTLVVLSSAASTKIGECFAKSYSISTHSGASEGFLKRHSARATILDSMNEDGQLFVAVDSV